MYTFTPINMKNPFSIFALLVIAICMALGVILFPQGIFTYDNWGFYLYLPQLFIYHDIRLIDFDVIRQINEQYHLTPSLYQFGYLPDGRIVNRFMVGLALMLSPFFLIGHLIALFGGFQADGYSQPYQWAILSGGVFYASLGFWYLRRVLLKLFHDKLTALILLVFYLGTNIFFFATLGNPMPHVFVFTLYAALLFYTMRWHEVYGWKDAARIGVLLGLLIISRPSEIIAILIPLLWGIYNKASLIAKWQLLIKLRTQIGILILFVILTGLPQLIYWLIATGKAVYFPYNDAQSEMNLLNPRFAWVLFSYRKGWFLYSPLMLLIIPGFVILYRKYKSWFYPIFIYFFINLYLIASFSSLISYGFRAFVQSYGILIIPFGLSIVYLSKQKIWLKILAMIFLIGFIYLNVFQAWQWRIGILSGSRMTPEYYWRVFLKPEVKPEDKKLLLINRSVDGIDKLENEVDYHHRIIHDQSYENPEKGKEKYYTSEAASSGNFSYLMDSLTEFSSVFEMRYDQISTHYFTWFRASVKVYPEFPIADCETHLVIDFKYKGKYYKYRAVSLTDKKFEAKPHQWNTISMDYLSPELRSRKDMINVYIWHSGKKKVLIDELKVEAFTVD